jgi:hypothetical protein
MVFHDWSQASSLLDELQDQYSKTNVVKQETDLIAAWRHTIAAFGVAGIQPSVVDGAMISIETATQVRAVRLVPGVVRIDDSGPAEKIDDINPDLRDWWLLSIPGQQEIRYTIHILQPGTIYVLGGHPGDSPDPDKLFHSEGWESADDAIKTQGIAHVFRRSCRTGETLQFSWWQASIVAKRVTIEQ